MRTQKINFEQIPVEAVKKLVSEGNAIEKQNSNFKSAALKTEHGVTPQQPYPIPSRVGVRGRTRSAMLRGLTRVRHVGAVTVATVGRMDIKQPRILNSWKEIAAYLQRGVRTVQRWHLGLGLPVHKLGKSLRSPVFAYRAEVEDWMQTWAKGHREILPRSLRYENAPVQLEAENASKPATQALLPANQQRDQLLQNGDMAKRLPQVQARRTATE